MDYGALAEQLYRWQLPGGQMLVHRVWGRNFHANRPTNANPSTQPAATDKDPS
jgi:CRISPR system Cascade subunit CasB